MGYPMVMNLIKAGYCVTVYDVVKERIDEAVKKGAKPATSPREVAEASEIDIIMVPNSPQVEDVAYGDNGILVGTKSGDIIIDMSSVTPSTDQKLFENAAKKGVKVLDAPVSGGEKGAIEGTLSIMVGGERNVFEECKEIFEALGKSTVLVGDIGAGQVTKLVNQIIVGITLGAIAEGFTLGAKAGVDPEKIFNAIKNGFAGSGVMKVRMPNVLEGDFKAGFKILHQFKDLDNALSTAREFVVALPLTSLVHEMYLALKASGKENFDHSAIVTLIEDLAGTKVRKFKN